MSTPDQEDEQWREYGAYRRLQDLYGEAADIIERFPRLAGKFTFPPLNNAQVPPPRANGTTLLPLQLSSGDSIIERAAVHAAKHANGEPKKKRLRRLHTPEFKAAAVARVQDNDEPIARVAEDIGIVRSLLDVWIAKAKLARRKHSKKSSPRKVKTKGVNGAITRSIQVHRETLKIMPDDEPIHLSKVAEILNLNDGSAGFRLRDSLSKAGYVKAIGKGLYQKTSKGLQFQNEPSI